MAQQYRSYRIVTATQTPGSLVAGTLYPLRALTIINRTPGLWRFVIIPILVNILVGVGLYASLLYFGFRRIDAFITGLPAWAAMFDVVLQLLLGLGLFVAIGFLLVRFGVVLGSPWYSQLSEQLELTYSGQKPPTEPTSVGTIARDIWRALMFELKKLGLLIGVGVPLLLLNLIPVAGSIIATVGGVILGATIVCLDFLDPPLERRRLTFREKLQTIRRSLPATAGFGLVCLGLISIPLINLFSIPLCITAGTLFFCDRIKIVPTS